MPKLEAGQTIMSGLAGFSEGLIEGMKYRKELEMRQAQMQETRQYREEQADMNQMRFEQGQSEFDRQMKFKEKEFEAKYGPDGTQKKDDIAKEMMNIFGRERQLSDSNLRATIDANKLSTDINKTLETYRMQLDDKEFQKFDTAIMQLRAYASKGEETQAYKQLAMLQEKFNLPASVGEDIISKQVSIDKINQTIADNSKRLDQLDKMKSSYVRELEARTKSLYQDVDIPEKLKEDLIQGTLEVKSEEDARRVIPNLMRIQDDDARNKGAELILEMLRENQKLPNTNQSLPQEEVLPEETKDLKKLLDRKSNEQLKEEITVRSGKPRKAFEKMKEIQAMQKSRMGR